MLLALQYNMAPKPAGTAATSSQQGSPSHEPSQHEQPSLQLLENALEKLRPVHTSNQEPFAAIQNTMTALKFAVAAP